MKLIKLWEADFDRAYELQNTFVQDENDLSIQLMDFPGRSFRSM